MNHVANSLNIVSLCSGVGWLDEGVRIGLDYLGFRSRLLCLCERDAYAASVLLARMEDASMERAPVFCGDMRDLDARPMRPFADVLVAGLPCQPYSYAGKKRGHDDQRSYGADGDGPLPQSLRIIEECEPALVFLENVPAWVLGGWFRRYGEELSGLGYTIESPLFVTASSVGASHKRERVFILAHRTVGLADGPRRGLRELWESSRRDGLSDGSGERLADTGSVGRRADQPRRRSSERTAIERSGDAVVDAEDADGRAQLEASGTRSRRCGPDGASRDMADASIARSGRVPESAERSTAATNALRRDSELGDSGGEGHEGPGRREARDVRGIAGSANGMCDVFAPGPSDPRWKVIVEEYPHLVPATEPGFRVLVDGKSVVLDACRTDQLRCSGNGVVAISASVALVELMRRVLK